MHDYCPWHCLTVLVVALGLTGVVGLGGCASSESSSPSAQAQASASEQSRSIPFRDRQSGLHADGLKFYTLKHITSQSQFKQLNLEGVNPANFKNADMVLLGLGEQPTGGYWVRITGLRMHGQTLKVQGVANRPGKKASVSQSITQPYCIVTTPKIEPKQVTSDIRSVTGKQPKEPAPSSDDSQ